MNKLVVNCVLFAFLVLDIEALHLPSYLTACSKNDPKFTECATKSANAAMKVISIGDPTFKVPPLKEFKLNEVFIDNGETLKIKFTDVIISGLENLASSSVNFDFEKKHVRFITETPLMQLDGHYDISGRILVLPISGNGTSQIKFDGCHFIYDFDYDLVDIEGKQYAQLKNDNIEFTPKKIHFDFKNLFNGNVQFGTEMNKVLNENWEEVGKEVSPAINKTIKTIITSVFNKFLSKIPFDELVKDN
ncbi:PREDICTED: protein takeout-like [Nicrophorus vespilloides]|uniref:Protein takeout-like n=1 Tax=Nicrophorus vespilloides TaxID=110193 RepID=A0ABM1MHB5_NICVS|nr:PREDICTED: protein takeout-like [Nicrophorus vespilloides]